MFSGNNPEIPQKSLQIQQDDKFLSRILSKESSVANPSLRSVYYGGLPGAVPFLWESQPGTPKSKLCDDTLPPLTPPPSYLYTNSNKKTAKKTSRSNLLHTLFPKNKNIINVKKTKQQSLPSQSSPPPPSFWSPSDSSMVFPMNTKKYQGMGRFSSPTSSFDSLLGDDDDDEDAVGVGSPTSTLCFSFTRVSSSVGLRGCYGRSLTQTNRR